MRSLVTATPNKRMNTDPQPQLVQRNALSLSVGNAGSSVRTRMISVDTFGRRRSCRIQSML